MSEEYTRGLVAGRAEVVARALTDPGDALADEQGE